MAEVWSVGTWWHKGARWGVGAGNGRACMEVCCLLTSAAQMEIKLSPCQNFRQCLESVGRGSTAWVPLSPQWEWWGRASGSCHSFSPLERTRAMGYEGRTKSLHRSALVVHLQQAVKKQLLHLERSNGLKTMCPSKQKVFLCQSPLHHIPPLVHQLFSTVTQLFTSRIFLKSTVLPRKGIKMKLCVRNGGI